MRAAVNSLLPDALDALPGHIALLDAAGDVVAVNRSWANFTLSNGYDAGGTGLGASYCRVQDSVRGIGDEEAHAVSGGVRRVLAGGIDHFEQLYACDSPSAERWFRMDVRRIARPGPIAAIVTHTDTTREQLASRAACEAQARAEAEHQSRSTEQALFRALTERSREVLSILDAEGRFKYIGPSLTHVLGYTPKKLLGTSLVDIVHPADRAIMLSSFHALIEAGESGVVDMMVRLCHRNGSWGYFEVGGQNLFGDPAVAGIMSNIRDVTTRVEAERAHRASEYRFRRFVETTHEGVMAMNVFGGITYANPRIATLLGYTPDELVGRVLFDFKPVMDQPAARERFAAVAGAAPKVEETQMQARDGSIVDVLVTPSTIVDEHGQLLGVLHMISDVTERKVAERATNAALHAADLDRRRLETERTHLATIFDQAPSFLAVMRGPEHTYERVNPAYERLVGQRQLIGKTVLQALPELREQGFIDLLEHVYTTGEPFVGKQLPVRLTRAPGAAAETRYIDLVYQRLAQSDGEYSVVSHGVDVTGHVLASERLQRSEERLREQFAKLPVPTFLWEDRDGELVLSECNRAAQIALPQLSGDVTGRTIGEILPGMDSLIDDMKSCLADNIVIHRSIEIDVGEPLERRSFDLTIGPQQPDRVLMHAMDRTARSLLEVQLRQAQKMEAVGQLAGGVAHDFNNLLTVISAHSAFLMESLGSDDPQREDAEAIHNAGIRAAGLTRQLLAFSRKQILKPQVMDLNACIEDTRKMLDRLLGEDIEIIIDLGDHLQHVVADPGQIDQVIVNLAVNARDAMQLGGSLTITTRMVVVGTDVRDTRGILLPGNYVKLAVQDTGHGMDAAVQSRLFEPFFTTKELGKGTGLGLATVYGIVKQSGGYITVDSAPGAGTTFHIHLPAVPSDEEGEQLQEAERAAERGVETILLVEDEPVVREVARRVLRRQGYVVLEAANGQDALSVSAAFPSVIHLVISDAVMPGMPAAEAVRRLQQTRPNLKAIYMSGYTDDDVVRRGIASAAGPFIQKPFAARELARAVRGALDSSHRSESQPSAP